MSHPDATAYNYCALPLAPYACRPDQSQGRIYEEPSSAHRTAFQRDRDRIIHSSAFRRLKYKTQVFVYHEGDHYRTRLTHTLEVAQITRSIARALMVNEDLAEGIALAHDLGHTPFAHIGEEYLQACMKDYGGFDHNDQSLRVLTTLERKYPKWNGLNLTWETLEGVVKHNGPLTTAPHIAVRELQAQTDLRLSTYASVEAQVAALSDDIAYNNHDVEDGLRAGMFTIADLEKMALLGGIIDSVRSRYPGITERYLVQEMIREMIGAMVEDVLTETRARLAALKPKTAEDIRMAGRPMVAFSESMRGSVDELRTFLYARMYRHYTMQRIWIKVERIVTDLFGAFHRKHTLLPDNWQARILEAGAEADDAARARIVADYIAGMTDRYAIREHERLFDLYWDLR
ncbi:MAG: deoxyguanosinetriphosphate triphosphohydrolase [Alphaproteobacteria bacterium]|nr:deoxyguanosinetriphosphate triphosphohydrolase [Alphaproteobacteria bacterium]MBP7759908.1 deoxyguanosinetriphosphate triphosphohydrolase [Alphaproteobacteria bacterium]MBP7763249.1 deoxyguanosinetriphosphate triphosphohydrolase [Alphaproteobacteria bacterium]MBP7904942.1 deoxyguanosinetriphosphate triphosphohydrolase [Alphaproteobacteria bacterium]